MRSSRRREEDRVFCWTRGIAPDAYSCVGRLAVASRSDACASRQKEKEGSEGEVGKEHRGQLLERRAAKVLSNPTLTPTLPQCRKAKEDRERMHTCEAIGISTSS